MTVSQGMLLQRAITATYENKLYIKLYHMRVSQDDIAKSTLKNNNNHQACGKTFEKGEP